MGGSASSSQVWPCTLPPPHLPPDTLTCNCWKLHGALMVPTLLRAARHSRNWAFVTAAANRSIMEIVGFQVPRTWNVCGSQKLEPRCGAGGDETSQTLACCLLQAPPTPTRGRPRGWDVTLRPAAVCTCQRANVLPGTFFKETSEYLRGLFSSGSFQRLPFRPTMKHRWPTFWKATLAW